MAMISQVAMFGRRAAATGARTLTSTAATTGSLVARRQALPAVAASLLANNAMTRQHQQHSQLQSTRGFSSAAADEDIDVDGVAYGFMASQALFTGLESGVFDALAASPSKAMTKDELVKACGMDAPRFQTLLTSLVAIKCLKRDPASSKYTMSPNTERFLVMNSKQYYGDYLRYQMGRQFYHRMGALPDVMSTGEAPSYASWFSDPETAKVYTQAQHNGSMATARYLVKKKLELGGVESMLDVGGGSGAFSYVFTGATPGLKSTVLELPEVCRTGEGIKATMDPDVQSRVSFKELDATNPDWPVDDGSFDIVLLSYISGSVPEPVVGALYANAYKALKPGTVRAVALICSVDPSASHEG
jgi:hypothetical protein